ncbi:hypothetical protein [Nitrosomonas ureae]|uniref:Uncharacterized protein n=1 Tax=Nitrosomonas ureae TaxID=44577 RepID=A0A1H9D2T2_9PROT|nr:hypothetical protein [Nitrosomonas ureae]SEQ07143.1 hypothetical protein SAMN05421510_101835 [Nitrosomonas ureae]
MAVLHETFDWLKPSLLRNDDGKDFRQPEFFQPQLLKFETDEFMENFLAAASSPNGNVIKSFALALPESGEQLKLFQPGHGNFYLVCASLCCRIPGFPDRKVKSSDKESVFFVLRKFIGGAEYAWVGDDSKKTWQPLNGNPQDILEKEERLPLMSTVGSDGHTLLFGYLPVASRETYAVSPEKLVARTEPTDIRMEELQARFIHPLTERKISLSIGTGTPLTILEAAQNADAVDALKPEPPQGASRALTLSICLLLELWEFFEKYLPDVAISLRDNLTAPFQGDQAQDKSALITFLHEQKLQSGLRLDNALQQIARNYKALNQPDIDVIQLGFNAEYSLIGGTLNSVDMENVVKKALDKNLPGIEVPKIETGSEVSYSVRCVYERPHCELSARIVSQPSLKFQLASFFDPDAPVRPVRITLPTDVSIAGLRRYKKSVTFLISSSLQKKIDQITGNEKSLLTDDPKLADEGGGLAFMCSFSFHIIFIVAFFLLLIFMIILNFVFWWIAFFKICLSIPKKFLSG